MCDLFVCLFVWLVFCLLIWDFQGFGVVSIYFGGREVQLAVVQILVHVVGDLYLPSVLYKHRGANCKSAGEFGIWKESTSDALNRNVVHRHGFCI